MIRITLLYCCESCHSNPPWIKIRELSSGYSKAISSVQSTIRRIQLQGRNNLSNCHSGCNAWIALKDAAKGKYAGAIRSMTFRQRPIDRRELDPVRGCVMWQWYQNNEFRAHARRMVTKAFATGRF